MRIEAFIDEKWRQLKTTQIIVLFFVLVILIGSLLLDLPISSRTGKSAGFFSALFTATSATCVAGFSLMDIWTQWSPFGQVVILILIEIGGLGFMSTVIFFILLSNRRVSMRQRMAMAQGLGLEVGGIVRLGFWVIKNSLIVQVIGAFLLTLGFLPYYGFRRALYLGITTSISAYCNCGLEFMGFSSPGIGFSNHITDPLIILPMSFLIIYGGLGFIVLQQIYSKRKFSKLNVYAKIVLVVSAVVIVAGMIAYLFLEWENPYTFGPLNIPQKIMAAFFQSINTRTAGFAGINQAMMGEVSKTLTCVLMMIGGAASSTSGGIKIDRAILAAKGIHRKVKLTVDPHAIYLVRVDGRPKSEEQVSDAFGYIFCYLLIVVVFATVNIVFGLDFITGVTASVACIGNVGPGFGDVGSMANYADFPAILKTIGMIEMLIGRLEIYPALYLMQSVSLRVRR